MIEKKVFFISVIDKADSLNRKYSSAIRDLIHTKCDIFAHYQIIMGNENDAENLYDNLDNAIDEYYKHKEERLTEKRNAILDNVDEHNKGIMTSIKNKFYKFKSLPTSARIVYIQGLQQKEGTFRGFTQLKESIGNKLKKKKYQSNKQQIEYLNQLKEGYINLQQMADNLANNAAQPQLEATSGRRLL